MNVTIGQGKKEVHLVLVKVLCQQLYSRRGLSMGMVTHCGSWVWVPMGIGMGHDLDTHVPMIIGLIPMVPSMAMINISWGGGVNRYLLMLVTTIELLWGWLGMIVVVRGDGGILVTGNDSSGGLGSIQVTG